MPKNYVEVGRVTTIYRHPVKSMGGETVEATKIGWHGVAGDRRFAFLRTNDRSGLPWISARDLPRLILYTTRFDNPAEVDKSPITITTPAGRTLLLDSAELLEELQEVAREPLQLMQLWRGAFDSMALSLITLQSISAISDLVGYLLEQERFRPNIVIEAFDDRSYPEDRWIDELIVFGDRPDSARIRVNRKDIRCMVVNLDLQTAKQDPAILREIVSKRKNLLGVYGSTERTGTIQVGDIVRLAKIS